MKKLKLRKEVKVITTLLCFGLLCTAVPTINAVAEDAGTEENTDDTNTVDETTTDETVTDETVTEATCYIAISNAPNYEKSGKCKGCNACSKNCPAGVKVQKLVRLSDKKNLTSEDAKSFHADACIGCGACTYGCMAGKNVREVIRCAKEKL